MKNPKYMQRLIKVISEIEMVSSRHHPQIGENVVRRDYGSSVLDRKDEFII